ncbi:MAG: radical SAM protein [Candidatus Omnitrophota bacterium]
MSKVALICNGSEQIGLQYISACLKARGHETRLFMDPSLLNDRVVFNFESAEKLFSMRRELILSVTGWKPDLIGISTVTITYPWARDIGKGLKEVLPDVPIIVGGPHAIMIPEVIITEPFFDMVCAGEGEQAIGELADSIGARTLNTAIQDIWFKRDGQVIQNPLRHLTEDLDSLPFPDRAIFEPYLNMNDSLLTMSQRGCVYQCTYCSHNVLKENYKGKGCYVRRKSPERFVEELRHFKELYSYEFVRIYDDIFTHDIAWLETFTPLYLKHINKPFFCLAHPLCLKERAVQLIKEAGCKWIQVGIESMNPQTRKDILNRPESNEDIGKAIALLEKYGIKYELDFIFGLPGDDVSTYEKTVDFLKGKKHLSRVSALTLSFLPKTQIVDHSICEGSISVDDIRNIEQGLEGCQTDGGSIRSKEKQRIAERYNVLYRLCAFMSGPQIDWVRRRGLDKILVRLNPFLIYLIRIFGMDTVDRIFVKMFFNQMFKVTLGRRHYYRRN